VAGLGTNAARRATQAARCAGGLLEVLNWWIDKRMGAGPAGDVRRVPCPGVERSHTIHYSSPR